MVSPDSLGCMLYGRSAAKDRATDQRLAIKKVSPMAKRTADARHTLRELLLLQFLGCHPNVRGDRL